MRSELSLAMTIRPMPAGLQLYRAAGWNQRPTVGRPLYRKFSFNDHFNTARTKCAIDADGFATPIGARPMEPSCLLYRQTGPAVADADETARELILACASRLPGQFCLGAPRLQPDWLAWLAQAGFTGNGYPGMPDRRYAITGPEFA